MKIANDTIASIHYTLTNTAGDVIDASPAGQPLTYLHGASNIVQGLEQALAGRSAGDRFEVAVAPEEGYGPRHAHLIQLVPHDAFHGVDTLEPGMQFEAQGGQGSTMVMVTKVDTGGVTVDGNHPLAGETLHFAIAVADVRVASDEELEHGHVHGAGGHHH